MDRFLFGVLLLILLFLIFVWAVAGPFFLFWFIGPVITGAAIGLPWYAISKRRERRMIREMDEAAKDEVARRV